MTRKTIAYRLEPVYEPEKGELLTAAVMTCAITGKTLSGMGGGGTYISPEMYDLISANRIKMDWAAVQKAIDEENANTHP